MRGHLIRLGRYEAVFDVFAQTDCLRTSEVLPSCKITVDGHIVFSGRCTISKLIGKEDAVRVEMALGETGVHVDILPSGKKEDFERFLARWLTPYHLSSQFKVAIADFEILLSQLRSWLTQIEIKQSTRPQQEKELAAREILAGVGGKVISSIASQHGRIEDLFDRVPSDQRLAYRNYAWTRLSPYFLCAPFGDRTYRKPLGFAGDYEMMNMIQRNQPEGSSLYSKLIHLLLVRQWPAESVRNRVSHLKNSILDETARVTRSGRRARILNLGCGPACEIQEFVSEQVLSNEADFVLIDFNEETLRHASGRIQEAIDSNGRRTTVQTKQTSVQQLLRNALRPGAAPAEKYDLIYCAGLFDYLADNTCKALVNLFCSWLENGGLVVVANMNNSKPFQHFIESILDWYLIYRSADDLRKWTGALPGQQAVVIIEPTSVNLFLHVRNGA